MSVATSTVQGAAQLLDARIGLKPDISFRPRLARALRDVAESSHIDPAALVGALAADSSLLDQLLDRVTVQETAFFRHPEQFDTLVRTFLPAISGPMRAWSAACANGQEAFSLAIVAAEVGSGGSVIASDVSPSAVERTSTGVYADREMHGVSPARRRARFVRSGTGWQPTDDVRRMVRAQRHNLLDAVPAFVGECHVVMCRNVLIYFTQQHAASFLDRLADAMNPSAHLFVGGAETLWQITDRFEPVQSGACYVYRPRPRRGATPAGVHRLPAIPAERTTVPVQRAAPAPVSSRSAAAEVNHARSSITAAPAAKSHDREQVGLQLLAAGSVSEAVVTFRQWAYSSPDDPVAHFQLGLALDVAGETAKALRAYRAALAALDRCGPDQLVTVLQGYECAELRSLLVARATSRVLS